MLCHLSRGFNSRAVIKKILRIVSSRSNHPLDIYPQPGKKALFFIKEDDRGVRLGLESSSF